MDSTRTLSPIKQEHTFTELKEKQNKIVRIVKVMSLLVMALVTLFMILAIIYHSYKSALLQGGGITVFGVILLINTKKNYIITRRLVLLAGNLYVTAITVVMGPQAGLIHFFFACIISPMFLYSNREWRKVVLYDLLTIILAILSIVIFELGVIQYSYSTRLLLLYNYSSIAGSLITVFLFSLYFFVENSRMEQSLLSANKELRSLSETDSLTGLANKRKYKSTLEAEWKRAIRNGNPLTMIVLDVDHFKNYNDLYGHQQGDVCLRRLADILKNHCKRVTDLAARYGGEEFIILLPESDAEKSFLFCETIRKCIIDGKSLHAGNPNIGIVSCSFGITTMIPRKDYNPSVLFERADKALYEAKKTGRNKTVCFEDM